MQNEKQKSIDSQRLSWIDSEKAGSLKALLIGIYQENKDQHTTYEHVEELQELVTTYGIPVVAKHLCHVKQFTAATLLSTGKVEEVQNMIQKHNATVVIFDDEISPSQQRNLEEEWKIPVMDRAEIILGVFSDRAHSREAKLQIELAQVQYAYPRLKRLWTHLSRQSGGGGGASGGGYLKGEGEKQIEIDRRILKKRISQLTHEIEEIRQFRNTQRVKRERTEIPTFALVGYTNVGKSTLMNTLTDAEVYVENKLFATLDTTTRKCILPNKQEILFTDTVGFVRKLPHQLVAAFRSTLEEAVMADFVVHVIDASHPNALEQASTTLTVLKELGLHDIPVLTVLNKIDQIDTEDLSSAQNAVLQKLRLTYARSVQVSAKDRIGIDALIEEMIWHMEKRAKHMFVRIPQSEYHVVAKALKDANVRRQEYEGNDVLLEVSVPFNSVFHFKKYETDQF